MKELSNSEHNEELIHGGHLIDNRYQIITCVGAGTFAHVYRAIDIRLEREVAIKILSSSSAVVSRFKREVKILKNIAHPNIVRVYDANLDVEPPYMVMEFIDSGSLDEYLSLSPVDKSFATNVLSDIANALIHLHSAGLLHRDIKPGNILVLPNRNVLTDFNLALDPDLTAITETNQIVGTPLYMAPELWSGEGYSEKTDIYSLSLVAFELFGGELETSNVLCRLFPLPYLETASEKTNHLIQWGANIDPKLRCSSARSFLRKLEQLDTPIYAEPPNLDKVRSIGYPKSLLVFIFCLLFITAVFWCNTMANRPLNSTKNKTFLVEGRLVFCPLASGILCRIKRRGIDAPTWILGDTHSKTKGTFSFDKGFWTAFVKYGNARRPLTFTVLDSYGREETHTIKPYSGDFIDKPRLFASKEFIKLQWRLHRPFPLEVRIKWLDNKHELVTNTYLQGIIGTCMAKVPKRAVYFQYSIQAGGVLLGSGVGRVDVRIINNKKFNIKPYDTVPIFLSVNNMIVLKEQDFKINTLDLVRDHNGLQAPTVNTVNVSIDIFDMLGDDTSLLALCPNTRGLCQVLKGEITSDKSSKYDPSPVIVRSLALKSKILKVEHDHYIIHGPYRSCWYLLSLRGKVVGENLVKKDAHSLKLITGRKSHICVYSSSTNTMCQLIKSAPKGLAEVTPPILLDVKDQSTKCYDGIWINENEFLIRTSSAVFRILHDEKHLTILDKTLVPKPSTNKRLTPFFLNNNSVFYFLVASDNAMFEGASLLHIMLHCSTSGKLTRSVKLLTHALLFPHVHISNTVEQGNNLYLGVSDRVLVIDREKLQITNSILTMVPTAKILIVEQSLLILGIDGYVRSIDLL